MTRPKNEYDDVNEAVSTAGQGIDRTQMRELLRVSPLRRLELLRDDVRGLTRLEERRDDREPAP